MRARRLPLIFTLALLTACQGETPDTGTDATPSDATPSDAVPSDAAPDAAPRSDATAMDAMATDATAADAIAADAMPDTIAVDAIAADATIDATPDAIDATPDATPPPDACRPDCADRTCGPDGCGALCGRCTPDAPLCTDGHCQPPPPVRINEIVTANTDGLRDEDGETPDWIELYNAGPTPVDLTGWTLTDDPADLARWRFPPLTLPGGGYLVVFASGKDRRDPQAPLHTNFALAAEGEFLALLMPDARFFVDALRPAPALPEDTAYGIAQTVDRTWLIAPGTPLAYHIPDPADRDLDPAHPDHDDADWPRAPGGLGYADPENPDPDNLTNLARARPATQTTTLAAFTADLATDGNPDTFTHTLANDPAPTLTIDLGGPRYITHILLHNRRGCCGSRLRDITVEILDPDQTPVWTSPLLNPENTLGAALDGPPTITLDLLDLPDPANTIGRYVRIHRTPDPDLSGTDGAGNPDEAAVLSLGEVEVLGGDGATLAHITTELPALRPAGALWIRAPFTLEDPARYNALTLDITYDAGFVAWLDATPIAAHHAPPAEALADPATPWRAHSEPATPRRATLALAQYLPALPPGQNHLALLLLNSAPADPDMLIDLTLQAAHVTDGPPRFFPEPTPGAPNDRPGHAGYVAPVTFDPPRGFHDTPLTITLATTTPQAAIHYTLDGTPPGPDDPIYDPAEAIPIDRTTVIRAIALRDDHQPAPSTTATYIDLEDITTQDAQATLAMGFPERWGNTTPDHGIDPRVINPDPQAFRDALLALPTLAITADLDDLFGPEGIYTHSDRRGVAWERPISLEYIDPLGEDWQINCGLRIQGGAFRSHGLTRKHSLRVLFKAIYGPTRLPHPFFHPDPSHPDAPTTFNGFTLRANSNDGWQWRHAGAQPLYIRDSFGRETHRAMGGISPRERWTHLYINGAYWGLYNPVERPDAAFGTDWLGGDRDDWDAVSNDAAADGDTRAWTTLLNLARAGVDTPEALWHLEGKTPEGIRDPSLPVWLDVDPYIDYMLTNLWVGNTDWPHKNWWVGRPRDGSFGFRFFMWDSEWSLGLRSDLGTDRIGVNTGVAIPWAALRNNPEFRHRVADRVHRHFSPGGALYTAPDAPPLDPDDPAAPDLERNIPAARFAALAATVQPALLAESARWGDQHTPAAPYTVAAHWIPERDRLLADYFPHRSARVRQHLRAAGLDAPIPPPDLTPTPEAITLTAEAGVIWYTEDGTDPRLPGGAIAPQALGGDPAHHLAPAPPTLRARALDPRGWSALVEYDLTP